MFLPKSKQSLLTKKNFFASLLVLSFIIVGCDKKSDRKRPGRNAKEGAHHSVTKGLPGQGNGDQPCLPPQAQAQVNANNPNANNGSINANQNQVNQNNNLNNGQIGDDGNQNIVPSTTQGTNVVQANGTGNNNGNAVVAPGAGAQAAQPCVPGQNNNQSTGSMPPVPNGNTVDPQGVTPNGVPVAGPNGNPVNGVLVPSNGTAERGTTPGSNPNSFDQRGSLNQNHTSDGNNGLNGSLTENSGDLSRLDDRGLARRGDSTRHEDEEDKDIRDDSRGDSKPQQIKTLGLILAELGNFYKNAIWTITKDRYNNPENFFDRVARFINKKSAAIYIKKNGVYTDDSQDHHCNGFGLELEQDRGEAVQKLYIYDCAAARVKDDPILSFRKNGTKWLIQSTIPGLEQVLPDGRLGLIPTIAVDSKDNATPFNPRCVIQISDNDSDTDRVKIESARCQYWGQQFTTSGSSKKQTIVIQEFKYSKTDENLFTTKARLLDFNGNNETCYHSTIERLAKTSDEIVQILDKEGTQEEDDDCKKSDQEREKAMSMSIKPPLTPVTPVPNNKNLVAAPVAQPHTTAEVVNSAETEAMAQGTENNMEQGSVVNDMAHQSLVPQTLNPNPSVPSAPIFGTEMSNGAASTTGLDGMDVAQPNNLKAKTPTSPIPPVGDGVQQYDFSSQTPPAQ